MIRKAIPKDYKVLETLYQMVSCSTRHFITLLLPQNTAQAQNLVATQHYVFEDKHKIKGFISIDENNQIGTMFVHPSYQKQNIGSKLLQYIRRNRAYISLKVFAQNTFALLFYQKKGFKIIAETPNPQTGETEVLMAWSKGCLTGHHKRHSGDS